LDPPISVLKVAPLEVVVSIRNIVSPVLNIRNLGWFSRLARSHSRGDAGSPELIRSVGDNGHVWPPLPLMSLQSKIIDMVGGRRLSIISVL
jgi:hypothetical protein